VARACEQKFERKLNIMEGLLQCLAQPTFDRELKLHIFVCIGDLILSCREKCELYLDDLLRIFDMAFLAAITLHNSRDPDSVEYAELLEDRLVEAYTCMIHGINTDKVSPKLIPGFKSLF
jgi:hypothetical protein